MTAAVGADPLTGVEAELAQRLVRWLETGVRDPGLFSDDVFADLTVPHWRLQAAGADATYRLREDSHPFTGSVHVEGLDRTSRGFLLKFEERWEAEGQQWYCREVIHCVVAGDRVTEIHISCTGDWDEARQRLHTEQVTLIRP